MRGILVPICLCLITVLAGCAPTGTTRPNIDLVLGEVTATLTRTPLPTLTPTPTATPIPTPRPLTATLEVAPPLVYTGNTLLIRVRSSVPASGTLFIDDENHPLFPGPTACQNTALVGVSVWAVPGPRNVTVVLRDTLGRVTGLSTTIEIDPADFPVDYVTLLPGRGALLDPQVNQDEWAHIQPILAEVTTERLWEGAFISPTEGHISSYFGAMRSYNGGPPSSYHNGLDIGNITGTLVVAPARGRVVLTEALIVRGTSIILDHGWGIHSGYLHLSEILVEEGQIVEQGQPIGRVGATGLVSGSHLHWEIRVGLTPVDPLEWRRRAFP